LPQVPQFERSVSRSRHTPPQSVRLAPHDVVHTPPEQTCPAAQVLPHAPQFARSLPTSRQTPPQSVSPALQLT
jgi:hypothetical protein